MRAKTEEATLSFESYQNTKYFPALDGLRGLSALAVITYHLEVANWRFLKGTSGVTVFFVLSGFLITTLALREEASRGWLSLKAFYTRRTFRIIPMYALVLLTYIFLVIGLDIVEKGEFLAALPYFATYLNEFAPNVSNVPFAQSWSLGVEEKFYLIWPLLGFVILRRTTGKRLGVLLILIAMHLFFFNGMTSTLGPSGMPINRLSASYTSILIGCFVAVCLNESAFYARARFLGEPSMSWLLAGLAAASLYAPLHVECFPYVVALFLISLVVGRAPLSSLLGSRLGQFLGKRSYGIYLIHVLVLRFVERLLRPLGTSTLAALVCFVCGVLISIAVADVLHRTVETPCIALGRRLSRRWMSTSACAMIPVSSTSATTTVNS